MTKVYVPGSSTNRIEDDEVLYTTLLLIQGEPPTTPRPVDPPDMHVEWSHAFRRYARAVKTTMKHLGHNPNQGKFTCFIHWHKEQWDAKQREQEITESETRSA